MSNSKNNLKEIALLFFKLGCIAFGGPAAHVAMLEEEVVSKRGWMSRQYFLDLMGATNLIPGPNSTEMVMHCGYERGGKAGLFVAGVCFIFPAVLLSSLLAWAYVEYGQLPTIAPLVAGIKPAVLAVIAAAVYKLGKKALKSIELGILGGLVLLVSALGVNEIIALLGAGFLAMLVQQSKEKLGGTTQNLFPLLLLQTATSSIVKLSTASVFWTFLKVGAVLYGSGYVLFAYLDAELVPQFLTRVELIDAVAVGQFTPGPVLSTATFIGYQLAGWQGAILATLGIFLPSFFFVLILKPFIPKMRQSKPLRAFLDAVNVAAVAVMFFVLLQMGVESLINWPSFVIAALAMIAVFSPAKISVMWVVFGGAVLGYLLGA